MNFALIVCTYRRSKAISNLFDSIALQTTYPNAILVIDASPDNKTEELIKIKAFKNTKYYKVRESDKGLTKQRNYGIKMLDEDFEVVCFLDDDVVLDNDYFRQLISTYTNYPDALGVGGYITNEVEWHKCSVPSSTRQFYYDGYCRNEPSRFRVRSFFGLDPDKPPCYLPSFSHGRSISFLPPSGKTYKVELFMGGVSSYKLNVFEKISFSNYFEGYGLYEDADFCLRLSKFGSLYVNTAARLGHFHDSSGRPNMYKYGKMVVRNGWYIWRVKFNAPSALMTIKWYFTEVLLMILTFVGAFKPKNSFNGLKEGIGRFVGIIQILITKPKIEQN